MKSGEGFLLEVQDLRAGYAKPVVGPVSFTLARGEIVGIAGPNGSGKTTLLNAIAGSAKIFSGSVRKRVGARFSYQQQNPLPLESIPLAGGELLDLTCAERSGLPEWIVPLLPRRLDRLSGGQLQFLQVWACMKTRADVVLLDEPTNNIDAQGVAALETALLTEKVKRGLLLITHERRLMDRVCDRVVELGK